MHQEVVVEVPVERRRFPRPPVGCQGTIVTVVEPSIRSRLDAATNGSYDTVHVETVAEARFAVRSPSTRLLLVSPWIAHREERGALARLVVAYPGVVTAAVVGEQDRCYEEHLLELGASGVSRLIDLREKNGWQKLRSVADEASGQMAEMILSAFMKELTDSNEASKQFFASLVRLAPHTGS